ncbi:MAG TPA: polysaccharide deacetylase family protein [Intrasporangiaceae bacterium]|nr:polysaccharide deacetylase family protein [Intrasporangiaceae bacterium]
MSQSESGPATVDRLAGANRSATSVRISQRKFSRPGSAAAVYLARADDVTHAMTAGGLSDGPVLLVPACSGVPAVVAREISRLNPPTVFALGSTAAVCDDTLRAAAGSRATGRLGGPDQTTTSVAIARHVWPGSAATVYLAAGGFSPDVIAGGALTDGPILLLGTDPSVLPQSIVSAIDDLAPARVVALGGQGQVTDAVLAAAARGRKTERIAGSNRYQTSAMIARRVFPTATVAYLARGDGNNIIDALPGGILVDGPMLIVPGGSTCSFLPAAARAYLADTRPTKVIAFGGAAAVCDPMLRQAALTAVPRPVPDCSRTRCVALTYDDGPGADTEALLNTLWSKNVPATFFVLGHRAKARPATVRRQAMEGHQVQNHTWSHPILRRMSLSAQHAEYRQTSNLLSSLGLPRTDMLRPPYGEYNANTRKLGVPLILWDVDPLDWRDRNSKTVRTRVLDATRPGSIILMHDWHRTTVAAASGIIDGLRARGYAFVTVDQLVPDARPGDVVFSRTRINRAG